LGYQYVSFAPTAPNETWQNDEPWYAAALEVPLRERNGWLLAAGYAPVFSARTLDDGISGTPYVRGAISRLLTSHEPYPVLVKDRYRNVIDRNRNGDAHTGRREVMEPRANSLRMALRDRLLKKYRRRPPVNQHPCS
jgi:hypothetical protein